MRALVVEDSRLVRRLIRERMNGEFDIFEASGAEEALRALRTHYAADHPIGLVLLANTLIDDDGYALCAELRRDSFFENLPVFLMGSSDDPSDYKAGFEAGASGYLSKPFEKEELLNLLMMLSSRTTFKRDATVLVVDDSPSIRVILRKTLVAAGFTVIEAEDGVEGLEKLAAGGIDIVSSDVEMPRLDGIGFLMEARRRGGFEAIPKIVLTSCGDDETKALAAEAGASDFLTKPFQCDEYLKRVTRLLDTKRDFSDYNIFLADDSPTVRSILDGLLASRGFRREAFSDGVSLLNRLERLDPTESESAPDLVLLDLLMPRLDGIEVLKSLRGRPAWAGLPVLMLSSYDKPHAVARALDAGANDFIRKPFDEDEVMARIKIHLRPK